MSKTCEWVEDQDDPGVFDVECAERFILNEGTLKENNFRYCPYCGRYIKEVNHEQ